MVHELFPAKAEEKADITFLYKTGTSKHYRQICFGNYIFWPYLLFNGLNTAIDIDEKAIDCVLIEGRKYSIDYIEKEEENSLLKLKDF